MSAPIPIIYKVFVFDGLRAWLSVNDVPWLPTTMNGSYSTREGANHQLIDGVNEVSFRVELSPLRRKAFEATSFKRWFVLSFHRPIVGTQDVETLVEYVLPDEWDRVPEDQRKFPFVGSFLFDPRTPLARMSHWDATATTTPCEGTPELRQVVREIHAAYASHDRDRMVALCEMRLHDYARAYPLHPEASIASNLAQLDELLAGRPIFDPLVEETLHFEARSGGRVVHVTRCDGVPVLSARGGDIRYTSDLLLAMTPRGWRLI